MKEGDQAPPFVREKITRTDIVRYAAASGDFNPIHHDELLAIRAGNDRVFAMGMMTAGYLGHLVTDWLGVGNLRKFTVRFVNRVWPGDTLICRGAIIKKYSKNGENLVDCELWVENQRGEKNVVGAATAALPSCSRH